MKNLKNLSKFLFNILFILIFFFKINNAVSIENKIIFKISNKSFTTIDLDQRKEYLLFVGDNNNLTEKEIIEDFISVNIFNRFYIKSKNNLQLDEKVIQIYNEVLNTKNNKKDFEKEKIKKNIFNNLKLDLIRKSILEALLNDNKENIFNSDDDINLIYKFIIKYINIYYEDIKDHRDLLLKQNFKQFSEIESFLKNKNIDYFINEKEIESIEKLNSKLSKNIIKNNNFFVLENNNYISIIFIKKDFTTYEGLIANIYSVESTKKLDENFLKCENLNNINNLNIIKKDYEYIQLNDEIKNNLISINDYVKFVSDENINYVILCGLKFNKDVLNNININKKINNIVNKIEDKFIKKYSKKYNLKVINE